MANSWLDLKNFFLFHLKFFYLNYLVKKTISVILKYVQHLLTVLLSQIVLIEMQFLTKLTGSPKIQFKVFGIMSATYVHI